MIVRLRRACLVALCSLPVTGPMAVATVAPAALVACGGSTTTKVGKGKKTTPGKGKKVPGPSYDELLTKARAAAEQDDVAGAHKAYLKVEAIKQDVAVIVEHTQFLIKHRQPDDAVTVARGYYEAKPADARGQLNYGEALIAANKMPEAIEVAEGVISLDETSGAGYELRGKANILSGKIEAGVDDLRKAVELAPDDANILTSLGMGLQMAKLTDEAGIKLRAAVEKDPTNSRSLRLLGQVRREQFEVQDSVKWLLEATKADPGDAEAWFQLAVSQNQLGDDADAEASAERATRLVDDNTKYWYVYGEMLRIRKKPEQASDAYQKALAIKPPHPKAAAKIAVTLYDSGKYAEAEVFLTEQIKTDDKNPYLFFNLGRIYAAQKKYKLGIESYERFLQLAPKGDGDIANAKAEIKSLKRKL